MKMLITSGGTKVAIDPVRDITNKSKGTFGSKIAAEALRSKHRVIYLRAEGSKSPLSLTIDFKKDPHLHRSHEDYQKILKEAFHFAFTHGPRMTEHTYEYYQEYSEKLEQIIKTDKPEIVVLAAAVSDYLVKNPATEKVRSFEQLQIELEHAEKLISKIKEWHPECILVGFKMLYKSTEEELFEAARKSIHKNGCDIVVANDYMSILERRHEVLIVRPGTDDPYDATVEPFSRKVKENLAHELIREIETMGSRCGYV